MEIWNKRKPKKVIDWKEISKDLRADLFTQPFVYRTTQYYK